MIHIMVGAALGVGEAQSLRWKDGASRVLSDDNSTNVLHLKVLGKHSKGAKWEEAYGTAHALGAFHPLQIAQSVEGALRENDDTPIFKEHHRDGFRLLLEETGLREHEDGRTRDLKSLRPTGISLRLDGSELSGRGEVGAHVPRDDRELLRPDEPGEARHARARRFNVPLTAFQLDVRRGDTPQQLTGAEPLP